MTACSRRPRARLPTIGNPSSCRCSARRRSATTRTADQEVEWRQWTYFGADLAYHYQKAQGADELIDIWGADHAGTVKRIVAASRR